MYEQPGLFFLGGGRHRFDRELDKVVEGGAAEEEAETTKKAKFTSAVRFEVHVMIVEGFSLALGSLHATVGGTCRPTDASVRPWRGH